MRRLLVILAAAVAAHGAEIPLTLHTPARVSVGIYDAEGRQLREVIRGEKLDAGGHRIVWDGLDAKGRALAPGRYEWRAVVSPGFTARFLTLLGGALPENPAPTIHGNWIGDHGGPGLVAADSTGLYVAAAVTEGAHQTIKLSLDAKRRLWSRPQYYDGGQSRRIAADESHVFLLNPKGVLRRLDAGTGAVSATWKTQIDGEPPADMEAHGGTLVVAHEKAGIVRWLDPDTGQEVARAAVPGARRLALRDEGEVLVEAGGTVFSLSRTAPQPVECASGLQDCTALAIERTTGDLLAADGPQASRIQRFDRKGALVRTYGGEPRALGRYDRQRLRGLVDLASDGLGGILIVESSAPRRVARIDAASGAIGWEKFGGMAFYVGCATEREDPALVWGCAPEGSIHQYRMDYATGRWDVLAVYQTAGIGDGLYPFHFGKWRPLRRGKELFLMHDRVPALLRVDQAAGKLVPVAIAGRAEKGPYPLNYSMKAGGREGFPAPWVAAVEAAGHMELAKAPRYFAWADANGDGEFQPGEWRLAEKVEHFGYGGGGAFDEDLNYVLPLTAKAAWVRMPRVESTTRGAPVWDWSALIPGPSMPEEIAGFSPLRALCRDENGAVFAVGQGGVMVKEHGQHEGGAWPYQGIKRARVVGWEADGAPRFSAGRQTKTSKEAGTGKLFFPMHIEPGPHDTLVICDQVFQPGEVWTRDGLYAGSMFEARAEDGLPAAYYEPPGDDMQHVHVAELPDGRVVWFGAAVGFLPVYEVRGFDKLQRLRGEVMLEGLVDAAARTGPGLRATYLNDKGEEHAHADTEALPYYDPFGREHRKDLPRPPWRAVWEGALEALFSEEVHFELMLGADETAELFLDGASVLKATPTKNRVSARLTAGKRHAFRLEYRNAAARPELRVLWWSGQMDKGRVPLELLYPMP